MDSQHRLENHHGVLMNVAGYGVLIIGPPAIGKSSLALALLSQHHQLIADDIVEFSCSNNTVTGHCPAMLAGLLHTRELGLIAVPAQFGDQAWQSQYHLNYVVELTHQHHSAIMLSPTLKEYAVLNQSFPLLTLALSNPASLSLRLECWLNVQASQFKTENKLKQRQHAKMALLT